MQQREHEMVLRMLRSGELSDEKITKIADIDASRLAELKKQLQ